MLLDTADTIADCHSTISLAGIKALSLNRGLASLLGASVSGRWPSPLTADKAPKLLSLNRRASLTDAPRHSVICHYAKVRFD
jgi:hypothetical protein